MNIVNKEKWCHPNVEYMLDHLNTYAFTKVNFEKIGIKEIIFLPVPGARACYRPYKIYMDPRSTCFSKDYRGYKYKTFGGIKDLTPSGVILHELGHHIHLQLNQYTVDLVRKAFTNDSIRKEHPVTNYCKVHVDEDIAESLRVYLSNNDLARIKIPFRCLVLDEFYKDCIDRARPIQ